MEERRHKSHESLIEPLIDSLFLKAAICLTYFVIRMGDSVFVKLFGEESQNVSDLNTLILPRDCWVYGEMDTKRLVDLRSDAFIVARWATPKRLALIIDW